MFTLDELTLFFWNNSNDARSQWEGKTKDKVIVGWVHSTHQQEAASVSGSQSSYALAHCSKASNVSSNSVLSSWAMIRVTAGKYWLIDNDTYVNEVGRVAVSDNDEIEGAECEEACNSPLKGKKQANNNIHSVLSVLCQSLRFLEDLVIIKCSKESQPSKRKCASNQTSLPSECHTGDMWTKQVIPTLIYWLGHQTSPWYPAPDLVLEAPRTTCQELYVPEVVKKIPLDRKEDEPYILVSIFL